MVLASVLGLLALLTPGAAWAALNTTGLLGFYRFDERDAGATVRDEMGLSHGTMTGFASTMTSRVMGRSHGAIRMYKANGFIEVLDVSDHLDAFLTANAFTVSAWVKADRLDEPGGNIWRAVASRQIATTGTEFFWFGLRDDHARFIVNATSAQGCEGTIELPEGVWMHLAGVFDGATDTATMYVNGVVACTFAQTGTFAASGLRPLVIGGNQNAADSTTTDIWEGAIDNVLLYSKALTPAEVVELADGGEPQITKYWICATAAPCLSYDDAAWSLTSNGSANTTAPYGPYVRTSRPCSTEDRRGRRVATCCTSRTTTSGRSPSPPATPARTGWTWPPAPG
jgi:hypothetical protein